MNFPFPQPPQQQVDALLISDLPPDCREPDLLQLAQNYGRIKSCEIKRDFRNHIITVYAILYYHSVDGAMAAYRALNGARYLGKILRVSWVSQANNSQSNLNIFPQQVMPSNQPFQNKGSKTAQVHVSYISKQLNFIISEQFLRDIFLNFGTVVEISLKKTCVDPEMSVQNGYGFVHYPLTTEGIQSALSAVHNLHQVTMNQVTFDCSVSNQLNQILINGGERHNGSQRQRSRGAGGSFPASGMSMMTSSPQYHPTPQQPPRNSFPPHFIPNTVDPYQVPLPRNVFQGFVNPPVLTHTTPIPLPHELRPSELNINSAMAYGGRQRPKPYSPFNNNLPGLSPPTYGMFQKSEQIHHPDLYNHHNHTPYAHSEPSPSMHSESQFSSSSKTPNSVPSSLTNDSNDWSEHSHHHVLSNGLLDPFLGTPNSTPRTYPPGLPAFPENHSIAIMSTFRNNHMNHLAEPQPNTTPSSLSLSASAITSVPTSTSGVDSLIVSSASATTPNNPVLSDSKDMYITVSDSDERP